MVMITTTMMIVKLSAVIEQNRVICEVTKRNTEKGEGGPVMREIMIIMMTMMIIVKL